MNFIQIVFKSILDKIIAFFALIILSPLLIIIGLLIKIESPGPIMFKQRRVGQFEMVFEIYKFRSMYAAERHIGDIKDCVSLEEARSKYQTTVKNDPRITNLGKFIRKFYLDELPQFINVLKGEMSLVGPRPYTPSEIIDYKISRWRQRHLVKPGITGLSQIFLNGRKGKKYSRIGLDVFYVKNQSLFLDLYIFIFTFVKFFKGSSY